MAIPAWQVLNWLSVETAVGDWPQRIACLQALGASVHRDERTGRRHGQVLWGVMPGLTPGGPGAGGACFGLAWDWREVRDQVVVMADPMTVLSNLEFVGERGVRLHAAERLLCLHEAIHQVPWQDHVCQVAQAGGRLAA